MKKLSVVVFFVLVILAFVAALSLPVSLAFAAEPDLSNQTQYTLKQIDVHSHRAVLHFQPGAVKYVASHLGKEITLEPREHVNESNKGYIKPAMMSTFRSGKGSEHDYDDLVIWAKEEFFTQDFELRLTCYFENGAWTTKKIRIIKGRPRIISTTEDDITLALQPEN